MSRWRSSSTSSAPTMFLNSNTGWCDVMCLIKNVKVQYNTEFLNNNFALTKSVLFI
jgi:hypothetical protein